jgi:HK97 family phage major capsid protein
MPIELSEELKAELSKVTGAVNSAKTEHATALTTINGAMEAQNKAVNERIDKLEGNVQMISVNRDGMKKDPKRGYENSAEFFNEVIESAKVGNRPDAMPERLRNMYNTVGSDEAKTTNNPDGGFLIPPAFLPELQTTDPQAIQNDTGMMTRRIPMASPLVSVNARVDKNHASSVTGGFVVYRREETGTVTASKGEYEQINLAAHSLMGLSYASEEIIERSPISIAALIQSGFGDERVSKMNYERLWGTGVGQFLGIFNSDAKVEVAKESAQSADTIVGANIVKMRSRAWRYGGCVWMANQDCLVQLMSAHITGTNGDVFLFAPGNGIDNPDTLLGRPILFDENMATIGDAGDLALVNWGEYLEGTLGGTSFAESIHVRFVYNERAFRFTMYNDGAPWWRSALTPKKSAATLSPIVTLAARA